MESVPNTFPLASTSPKAPQAFGAQKAIARNEPVEEVGRLNLPSWSKCDEARRLLLAILIERPERTRVLTRTIGGTAADFGYVGKNASQLRAIWERTHEALRDWASSAGDRAVYQQRREAVAAYAEAFGADALIARVLK